MAIYLVDGDHWEGTQAKAGKGAQAFEIPRDKAGFIEFLTKVIQMGIARGRCDGRPYPSSEREVPEPPHPSTTRAITLNAAEAPYVSPMSGSTVVQRIDAGMCGAAIRRMTDGKALSVMLQAMIERLEQIREGLALPLPTEEPN